MTRIPNVAWSWLLISGSWVVQHKIQICRLGLRAVLWDSGHTCFKVSSQPFMKSNVNRQLTFWPSICNDPYRSHTLGLLHTAVTQSLIVHVFSLNRVCPRHLEVKVI